MLASVSIICCLAYGPSLRPVIGADGRTHWPLKEASGRPCALLFISHDCPIANTFAPEIGRIERDYSGKVKFFLVYSERRLSAADAKAHAAAYKITGATILLDKDATFAADNKAKVTPQAVLYDAKGKVAYSGRIDNRFVSIGKQRTAPTTHDFRTALDAVLNHKTPKPATTEPVGCFIVWPKPS